MNRRPSALIVGLATLLLAGCESAEERPETPPTTHPSPTTLQDHEDTPEPTSPPYSSPRPKVGPGSVMLEEENPREGLR